MNGILGSVWRAASVATSGAGSGRPDGWRVASSFGAFGPDRRPEFSSCHQGPATCEDSLLQIRSSHVRRPVTGPISSPLAIRPALPQRPWRWPAPSCRASPNSWSRSRRKQTCSALAQPRRSDRCWYRQAARRLAELYRAAGYSEFPASRAAKPRRWSARLLAWSCIRWSASCQPGTRAIWFQSC